MSTSARHPVRALVGSVERRMLEGTTTVTPSTWEAALRNHPDRLFASIIVEGLRLGFRIGFDRSSPLQSVGRNMPSASEQAAAVSSYVNTELRKGRFIGPFDATGATGVHISRLGEVPKGHAPRKWRVITNLSYPEGRSVNDGIDPSLCSLSYISVNSVASI